MSEYIHQAWTLLGVGMLTVFVILLIVVVIGNIIIMVVNKFFPEAEKSKTVTVNSIGNARMAAITAAVNMVTQGRGRITKIQKK